MRLFPLSFDIHYLMQRYKSESKQQLTSSYRATYNKYERLYKYGFGQWF